MNFISKPFAFIHDSLEIDIHPKELFYLIEKIAHQMNVYPKERFGVPMKSDVTLGYSMGEEVTVLNYKPDEDYKGGFLHLVGEGDEVDRLLASWAQFFDHMEIKVLKDKEYYQSYSELFAVKRCFHRRIGFNRWHKEIEVTLRYDKGEGCQLKEIEGMQLLPMKNYRCE